MQLRALHARVVQAGKMLRQRQKGAVLHLFPHFGGCFLLFYSLCLPLPAPEKLDALALSSHDAQRRGVVATCSLGASANSYGVRRVMSRGKSVTSLMFGAPTGCPTSRSSPMANPPSGGIPKRKASRYQ